MGDEHRTSEQAFTAISHEACPSLAETLLAVVAAWRPVDQRRPRRAARPDGAGAVRRPGATAASAPRALAAFLTRELRPDAALGRRAVARRGARDAARPPRA